MSFTGTAVQEIVSDGLIRITGLSLASGAAGTIGLHENSGTPDVKLPEPFKPREYTNSEDQTVTLQASVQVFFNYIAPGSTGPQPIGVVKTGSVKHDFLVTLTHDGIEAQASGELEIYVRYH